MGSLSVVILTQEDPFVIPGNVRRVLALPGIRVPLIAVLDTKGSLANRKMIFFRGFGILQSVHMGLRLAGTAALDALDCACGWRLLREKKSIRAVASRCGVRFVRIPDPNSPDFLSLLAGLKPDLVLSFSAPVVFKKPLLELPRLGCINLHCSHLPRYAGLLPSFWVLYNGESETGVTVHYMDDRIDNGGILAQEKVPVEPGTSMMRLIQATKGAGGGLVCRVLQKLHSGEQIEVHPNTGADGSYYSWPTVEQMKSFRRRGGRLV